MVNGLYMESPGKVLWHTVPDQDELKANEVKLKVIYGGICGSDIAVYKGKLPHAHYPLVPGHEILGEVIEAGVNATVAVGERVVVQPNSYCGKCEYCLAGKTNICPDKKSLGINIHGGFAETFIISDKYVVKVPAQLSNERAILIEPLAVIVHALKKVTITKNTLIAIIGCGTEGMLAIALAHHLGGKITAIDINKQKLNKVKEHYPEVETLHPDDVQENEFDIAMEVAGVKESFEQCIDIVKPGGVILSVGFPKFADIPVVKIVREEITIKGSIIYNALEDFQSSIDYLLDSTFRVEPIISEIIAVKEYERAYDMATSGKYRKILLSFE